MGECKGGSGPVTTDMALSEEMQRFLIWYTLVTVLVTSSAVYAHHTALPEGMTEPQATWLWGYHTVPASITRDGSPYWYGYVHTDAEKINNPAWTEVAAEHIELGAKAPAVLVLHGCAGVIRSPTAYRIFFMQRGYAVFEPDSFARPGRKPCEDDRWAETIVRRIEELRYSYKSIRTLPWVDQNRVVLMGISEGATAVAAWRQSGFAAHIIIADDCGGGQPQAPAGTPVLAVVGEKDEYFGGSSCNVTRKIKGSKSIIIPDAPHNISDLPETGKAVEEFLSWL